MKKRCFMGAALSRTAINEKRGVRYKSDVQTVSLHVFYECMN